MRARPRASSSLSLRATGRVDVSVRRSTAAGVSTKEAKLNGALIFMGSVPFGVSAPTKPVLQGGRHDLFTAFFLGRREGPGSPLRDCAMAGVASRLLRDRAIRPT